MATGVQKRGNTWSFRANIPGSGGKQIRRGGFLTAEAAYKERLRYLNGAVNGVRPSKLTVGDWLEQWLRVCEETLEPATSTKYRDIVGDYLLPLFGETLLQLLDEEQIRAGYRSMVEAGYSTNTILNAHRRLRSALGAALREAKLLRNPAANVKPPKGRPPGVRTVWNSEEARKFTRSLTGLRDEAMWKLLAGSGARKGEVLHTEWSDIRFERGEVWIRKSKTKAGVRIVPIGDGLVSTLRAWRASQAQERLRRPNWRGGDYVFTSEQLKPYHPASLNRRLKQLCRKAGVPELTVHEMRHTFATQALEAELDIKVVSELLGHANTYITRDLYQHVSSETARKASEKIADRMFG